MWYSLTQAVGLGPRDSDVSPVDLSALNEMLAPAYPLARKVSSAVCRNISRNSKAACGAGLPGDLLAT